MKKFWMIILVMAVVVVSILIALTLHHDERLPSGVRFVGEDLDPLKWSSDSKSVYYLQIPVKDNRGDWNYSQKWDHTLYHYSVTNGILTKYDLPRELGDMGILDIAPDGSQIAIAQPTSQDVYDILITPLLSKRYNKVKSGVTELDDILWYSPRVIVLVKQGKPYLLDIGSYKLQPLPGAQKNQGMVAASWDGRLLLLSDMQNRRFKYETESRHLHALGLSKTDRRECAYLSEQLAILGGKDGFSDWVELLDLRSGRSKRMNVNEFLPESFQRVCMRPVTGMGLSPDLHKCWLLVGGHYDYAWNSQSSRLYIVDTPKQTVRKLQQLVGQTDP